VKVGRKLDDSALKPLADGRVFSGKSALSHKLVDSLGDLEDAVSTAKTLAGLENKNPEIIYHKEKPSLGRLLEILGWSPLKKIESVSKTHMSISYLMK
jgi:ClpP class serine protease